MRDLNLTYTESEIAKMLNRTTADAFTRCICHDWQALAAEVDRLQSPIEQAEVFDAVRREREYQDWKWGNNPHTVGEWLLILERELNEAKEAWVTRGGTAPALEEILQVIAVGTACLEQHGIREREYPDYEAQF